MKVLKFGGTTLKNANDVRNIANIIHLSSKHNDRIIVVMSALFGITDKLLELLKITKKNKNYSYKLSEIKKIHLDLAQQLALDKGVIMQINALLKDLERNLLKKSKTTDKLPDKLQDTILSFGERLSSLIISYYLTTTGEDVTQIFPDKIIKTDSNFGCANVNIKKSTNLINICIKNIHSKIIICAGFFGSNNKGQITTLGRNGSDYSASLIASAINANTLEIWKDSDGLYTADPKIVKNAKFIKQLTYQEMYELSSCGNKVLHADAIAPCILKKIPIILKNCRNPSCKGTTISSKKNSKNYIINGINKFNNISVISVNFNKIENLAETANKVQKMLKNYNNSIITFSQNTKQKNILLLINGKIDEQFLLNIKTYAKRNNNCIFNIDQEKTIVNIVFSKTSELINIHNTLYKILNIFRKKNINIYILNVDFSNTKTSFLCGKKEADKIINLIHDVVFSKK